MRTQKILVPVLVSLTFVSCSGLAGTKGKFSEPTKGKALSVVVRRVSGGGSGTSVMLEVTNSSSAKVLVDPLKVKIIHEDGTETETTFNLKRKTPEEIEIAGGEIISGRLNVQSPNQTESVQVATPASLSPGERIFVNLGPGKKSDPDQVQVSFGPAGSSDQEVFAITK